MQRRSRKCACRPYALEYITIKPPHAHAAGLIAQAYYNSGQVRALPHKVGIICMPGEGSLLGLVLVKEVEVFDALPGGLFVAALGEFECAPDLSGEGEGEAAGEGVRVREG